MKRARTLQAPTTSLTEYFNQLSDESNWDKFRDYDDGAAYKQLLQALIEIQHGLCDYCELDLKCNDRQIEHLIPRSHPVSGAAHALDYTNIIACCQGGTASSFFGPDSRCPDEERFLRPARDSLSWGQSKGDEVDPRFLDPRELPSAPPLFQVRDDGKIVADKDACMDAGVSVCSVNRTIEILGLNVRRLRRSRADHWSDLRSGLEQYPDYPEMADQEARAALLPNKDGALQRFFTTSRSYFAPFSEKILAEQPQAWV